MGCANNRRQSWQILAPSHFADIDAVPLEQSTHRIDMILCTLSNKNRRLRTPACSSNEFSHCPLVFNPCISKIHTDHVAVRETVYLFKSLFQFWNKKICKIESTPSSTNSLNCAMRHFLRITTKVERLKHVVVLAAPSLYIVLSTLCVTNPNGSKNSPNAANSLYPCRSLTCPPRKSKNAIHGNYHYRAHSNKLYEVWPSNFDCNFAPHDPPDAIHALLRMPIRNSCVHGGSI